MPKHKFTNEKNKKKKQEEIIGPKDGWPDVGKQMIHNRYLRCKSPSIAFIYRQQPMNLKSA